MEELVFTLNHMKNLKTSGKYVMFLEMLSTGNESCLNLLKSCLELNSLLLFYKVEIDTLKTKSQCGMKLREHAFKVY